jgi:hypothetical protein
MWLAETSQQLIRQTTWLKVTPHCSLKTQEGAIRAILDACQTTEEENAAAAKGVLRDELFGKNCNDCTRICCVWVSGLEVSSPWHNLSIICSIVFYLLRTTQ